MAQSVRYRLPAGQTLTVTPNNGASILIEGVGFITSPATYGPYTRDRDFIVDGDAKVSEADYADYSIGDIATLAVQAKAIATHAGPFPAAVWPRGDCVLDVDFENNRFYWNGAVRSLSDLTANGDGSYDLAYGSWFSGDSTVEVNYRIPDGATAGGTLFSWTNAALDRVEFLPTVQAGGGYDLQAYVAPGGVYHNPANQFPGQSQNVATSGRRRAVWTIKSSTAPLMQMCNWHQTVSGNALGVLGAPSKLTFKRRARFNDSLMTNATLDRVVIWSRSLTSAEMNNVGAGVRYPVHLIGDSFLNLNTLSGALANNLVGRGYTPVTQDGVGGTTTTQMAARYALDSVTPVSTAYDISKWKNATLVIMDGGLDGTDTDSIIAIKNMLGNLRSNRWLYVEPAPQAGMPIGSALRWSQDATIANIRAFCGEEHFVPTIGPALAAGDNSPADNAEIAKGLWPLSLKNSTSDFHPSPAGHAMLAAQIYNKLLANGWA